MTGDIPTVVASTDCDCQHGEHGKYTICGGCMRESQIEAKRRKNKWRGN